jgi:hypothetical protein
VTTLGAVFDSVSAAARGERRQSRRQSRRTLVVRVRRIAVRGSGRRRVILIRIGVNARATVRARLLRGRRQVASRRWRVRAGQRVLRMRVPARARRGVYRLRLTIRDSTGQTRRVTRSVRLRR